MSTLPTRPWASRMWNVPSTPGGEEPRGAELSKGQPGKRIGLPSSGPGPRQHTWAPLAPGPGSGGAGKDLSGCSWGARLSDEPLKLRISLCPQRSGAQSSCSQHTSDAVRGSELCRTSRKMSWVSSERQLFISWFLINSFDRLLAALVTSKSGARGGGTCCPEAPGPSHWTSGLTKGCLSTHCWAGHGPWT